MPRPVPSDRFLRLVAAGTATFVTHGYRRTQMQDVADAMGVAKGTVYSAVASKDALLLACVKYADRLETPPAPDQWPLPAPEPGALLNLVSQRLGEAAGLALGQLDPAPADSPAGELRLVVSELMRRLATHRQAIKLIDRCAPEIPELATLWYGAGRAHLVEELREHLVLRAQQGQVRLTAQPEHWDVVARTLVETCVMWAVHLHWDPAPSEFRTTRPDEEVAQTLAAMFTAGLVPVNPTPP